MEQADPTLKLLNRLVGDWTTEATHPMMPGVVVHGTAHGEWLEGEKFLILRSTTDHPDFPNSISIFGRIGNDRVDDDTGKVDERVDAKPLRMQYYDSRGVFRDHDASADENSFSFIRIAPGFSQRFTGKFEDGGDTIDGLSQLRRDDVHWKDDLKITYHRKK